VRLHHSESLLDAEVQSPAHAPGDVPGEGAQAACQGAPGLRLAILHGLAGLERRGTQLLLGGVVGGLERLGPVGRMPQRGAQA
jgi:hypothetical protein